MDTAQYFAFVPLLLYGIGLANLLEEWKRIFNIKEVYLPYTLITIILTETALYNVFIYIDLIGDMTGLSYLGYLSMLVAPFLFLLATHAFTPDKEANTREYFDEQIPVFFTLMALFVASHFTYVFVEPAPTKFIRIVAIGLLLLIAFTRKIWPLYVVSLIWAASLLLKGGIIFIVK
ncbi:MAG: hypothetical protein IPK96_01850 [Flammeovirgaceae bacterium]|jgi:hypothetical protein|nr:hypothetical protein [Flammeovirgaceae bacterium]